MLDLPRMYLVVGLLLVSSISKFTSMNNRQRELAIANGSGVYMNLGKLNNTTTRHASRDGTLSLQQIQDQVREMDRNKDNVLNIPNYLRTIAYATRYDRNKVSLEQLRDDARQMDRNKNNVIDIPDEFVSNIPTNNRTQD